ncbi:acyltransferase family protein [Pseudoduganella plicata]|uniref:Acyltransferase n=1 Tax=Pseudoduganella plicata TaxID=321984 RepID=A0A4P7BEW6_9BURK|nr:acyltransferase [Pseudoduganella plicata]QBQ37281.1 acyltransferase [Pseudoduganella plicata]GGY97891.1 acyltransferase [Pseudoduganella plicata]
MIGSQRNPHIDVLRGAAIAIVLVLHFALAYGLKDSPLGTLFGPAFVNAVALNGNFGVTVFFVISGYLITDNSLRRWGSLARIDARAFYLARARRILPPLLLALGIITVLGSVGVPYFDNADGDRLLPASFFVPAVGSVLTFWHNVLMQSAGYFNYCLNIYWSLSVEEMFYLLLPLAGLLLRRTWPIVLLCVAAIVIGPVYRAHHADNELFYMYGYLACFDAIALGCLTALLAERRAAPLPYARPLRWLAGALLVAVYLRGIGGHEVFGFTWIALSAAVILLTAHGQVNGGVAGSRTLAPLRWMGRLSYELYLFHIIVLALLRNLFDQPDVGYATRLPLLVLFIALSALLAYGVQRALQSLRNRDKSGLPSPA